MRIQLLGKNKLGIVDDSWKKEDLVTELGHQWEWCNVVVQEWIMSSMTQDLRTGIVYATSARTVWEDLQDIVPPPCHCPNSKEFSMHLEKQKLMKFLMGLNENYDQSRSQFLMVDPTPNINKAYAMLVERESQISMTSSSISGKGTYLATLMEGKGMHTDFGVHVAGKAMPHRYNRGTAP
ncbi:hypothetical protein R3W88_014587 [Solanum pinnatisectum]|uniref:Retrotransposon Copia-like N-terminal domain-containing protein n=1 Tax=Solanum pinnatisectum TaxID=50273 RepID=A0AAV9KSF6_9SOLN|nr:hypothetical protein R3W88_014587 [Solanum pinnatisectum]